MHQFRTLGICAVMALALFSCKKDNDGTSGGGPGGSTPPPTTSAAFVEFTINGDGFTNSSFTLTPATGSGQAVYAPSSNLTNCLIITDGNNKLNLMFEGNGTGPRQCSDGLGSMGLTITLDGAQYLPNDNTMEVTAYGAVGEMVEGTFSGTVVRLAGPTAGSLATVTNGTFRFVRIADV